MAPAVCANASTIAPNITRHRLPTPPITTTSNANKSWADPEYGPHALRKPKAAAANTPVASASPVAIAAVRPVLMPKREAVARSWDVAWMRRPRSVRRINASINAITTMAVTRM